MTPKEKAQELIDKFKDYVHGVNVEAHELDRKVIKDLERRLNRLTEPQPITKHPVYFPKFDFKPQSL